MHDLDKTMLELGSDANEIDQFEFTEEMADEGGFTDSEMDELADELTSIESEAELDQFIGNFFKKAAGKIGSVMRSPVGGALGGILKTVAKKALPWVGGALGTLIPVPGVGTAIGSALGNMASNLIKEGELTEEHEFSIAKRYLRLAEKAVQNAISTKTTSNPVLIARKAALGAAKTIIPSFSVNSVRTIATSRANSGKWIRRGSKILILGA